MKSTKSKGACGAVVLFCGHNATFIADIITVGGACVVRASGRIEDVWTHYGSGAKGEMAARAAATHQVSDFPGPVYWRPRDGILVVPEKNVRVFS